MQVTAEDALVPPQGSVKWRRDKTGGGTNHGACDIKHARKNALEDRPEWTVATPISWPATPGTYNPTKEHRQLVKERYSLCSISFAQQAAQKKQEQHRLRVSIEARLTCT
jgi:hypothetical protein